MTERDANQLAADVRTAIRYAKSRTVTGSASYGDLNRADAALDELVGLVGTLQAEIERLRDVLEDEPEAVRLLSEKVGTLQQERDEYQKLCDDNFDEGLDYKFRAEAAEAALAEANQKVARSAENLTRATSGWRAEKEYRKDAERRLATTRQALTEIADTEWGNAAHDVSEPNEIARRVLADSENQT